MNTGIAAVYTRVLNRLTALQGAEGQGLAEYGLILALVAIVAIGAVTLLGTNVSAALSNIAGSL